MLITLFTPKAPTIKGFEFDAVLEDTFEAEYETTTYVIEAGASAADHRLILPRKWSVIGLMSNTPLELSVTDFVGGGLSNLADDSGAVATIAGISAGILAGSAESIASAALKTFLDMADSGESVTVAAGDVTLFNMVVATIRRIRTPANENGIELEIFLEELPTLDTLRTQLTGPKQDELREGDVAQSQVSALLEKGQVILGTAAVLAVSQVSAVLQ